jgi:Tfp pilus assembly protein PilV
MRQHVGFSFIEMMVSMLLLSLALLGLDAMTFSALREAKIAYYLSVANQQLLNMSELVKMKKSIPSSEEIRLWNEQNKEMLPQGRGKVNAQASSIQIAIFWGKIQESMCNMNKIGQSGCVHFSIPD